MQAGVEAAGVRGPAQPKLGEIKVVGPLVD